MKADFASSKYKSKGSPCNTQKVIHASGLLAGLIDFL